MGYEQAPSTKMLATHCVMCNRALRDAVSVEIGIGPICRKHTSYDTSNPNRSQANKIIHSISLNRDNVAAVRDGCLTLVALDFTTVAEAIVDRLGISVVSGADCIKVRTPFSWDWVNASKRITGRRWVRSDKVTVFPKEQKAWVYHALKKCFSGFIGNGSKGLFVVGGIND